MRKRKWLSLLLCAVLVITVLPATVLAASANGGTITEDSSAESIAAMFGGGAEVSGTTITLNDNITLSGEMIFQSGNWTLALNNYTITGFSDDRRSNYAGGSGITVAGGFLSVSGGSITGGTASDLSGKSGGAGIAVTGGSVMVSDCTLTGGKGGWGTSSGPTGGTGGSGIAVSGDGSVTVLDSSVIGGGSGSGGYGSYNGSSGSSGTAYSGSNTLIYDAGTWSMTGTVTLTADITVGAAETLTIPDGSTLIVPDGVTLTNNGTIVNNGTINNYGTITGSGSITGNVPIEFVKYLDEIGTSQTCTSPTEVTADYLSTNSNTLSDGWYVVRGIVEVSQRITVNGDVHLILADQSSLNVKGGIGVPQGSHFQIFGQAGQTGSLIATEDLALRNCGIGGTGQYSYAGDVTVNGGQITAGAGLYSAAIGGAADGYGGNVTINGGTVTATGNDSPAIGGGYNGDCGNITINGGTISATGGRNGAGIGGGNNKAGGTITINGGEIEATGGYDAAGIGGGRTGNGGTITINGGSVTAKSGGWGAGIGGGYGGSAGYIVINNGTVNASCTGTYGYGAGIGSGGYNEGFKTNDGTIIINGGYITATNQVWGAGIGGGYNYTAGTVIITGGNVAAVGNRAGIGGGQDSSDGSFTTNITNEGGTTTDGNAIIFASSISDQSGKTAGTWSGVIFEGDAGQVYGTTITPIENFTIESGKSLLIPTGSTLNISGITAASNGNVYVDGTLNGTFSGSGSLYYPLIVNGGTASPVTVNDSKTYAKEGEDITLTATDVPVGQAVSGWTASDSGVTVENNAFTMPSKALTVTAQYVNAPTYTVTIPASVTLDSMATISAEGVNVVSGSSLVVKLTDAQDFKLKNAENVELSYSITKDSTALSAGDTVLTVAGGTANNSGNVTLAFSAPATAVKYSGDYKGTITFTVSIADGGGT